MGLARKNSATISIGDMRAKAEFQSNSPVANNSGGFTDNYTTFYTCRGRLLQAGGGRKLEQADIVAANDFEFVCRFTTTLSAAITATMRVVIGTDNYAIKNVTLVDQINHWYEFILSKTNF